MIGPRLFALLALAAVALSTGAGCGTVYNVRRPTVPPAGSNTTDVCKVYGGVRGDFAVMADYPWSGDTAIADYIVLPAFAIVQLALDACGDTVTLPYTLGSEIKRALKGPTAATGPVVTEYPLLEAAPPAP